MDELTTLIDRMVHEKTFSMEGVEAIKALRDQASQMEVELEDMQDRQKGLGQERDKLQNERDNLKSEITSWKSREGALVERERRATELEKASAVANAKAETFKECVGLVFRNTTLRREMFGQQPVSDNTGYTTSHSNSETVTETVE